MATSLNMIRALEEPDPGSIEHTGEYTTVDIQNTAAALAALFEKKRAAFDARPAVSEAEEVLKSTIVGKVVMLRGVPNFVGTSVYDPQSMRRNPIAERVFVTKIGAFDRRTSDGEYGQPEVFIEGYNQELKRVFGFLADDLLSLEPIEE